MLLAFTEENYIRLLRFLSKPTAMFKDTISYNYQKSLCPHYYLAQYMGGTDKNLLSQSLLGFKRGRFLDLVAWIDCARQAIQTIEWPTYGIVVRAMHSYEANRAPFKRRSLDYLGGAFATELGWRYVPEVLFKIWPTQKLHQLDKHQREDEMRFNYAVNLPYTFPDDTPVLIIDDISTTGSTLKAILDAFVEICPSDKLTTFTLAKTGYNANIDTAIQLKGKNYEWQPDKGWLKLA